MQHVQNLQERENAYELPPLNTDVLTNNKALEAEADDQTQLNEYEFINQFDGNGTQGHEDIAAKDDCEKVDLTNID